MKNLNYSILVNTTDSFEDCWHPFFKLFKKYWPEYKGKIYLNSEKKEFTFEGLNIIPIKNQLSWKPWSQCLKHALSFIEAEYILYMQDDYFFHSNVKNTEINKFFNILMHHKLDCLHLTDQCTSGPFNKNTGIEDIWEINKGVSYRLSTQAALWNKESLLKLIRNWESGWQFEKYGTKRSNYLLNKIMCVNRDKIIKDKNEIIPYVFTGIIKGKWKKEVKELFRENDINWDFSKRGFYHPELEKKKRSLKNKISLLKNRVISTVDLLILKGNK